MRITSPVDTLSYRLTDVHGQGHFGASRGSRTHDGVDIITTNGEAVYAPMSGIVSRLPQPYSSDSYYKGVDIEKDNKKVRIFYIKPVVSINQKVRKGQLIGYAQNIESKYTGITNHVHLEYSINNTKVDPKEYLVKKRNWFAIILVIVFVASFIAYLKINLNESR